MSFKLSQFCRDVGRFKEIIAEMYARITKMEYKLQKLYDVRKKILEFRDGNCVELIERCDIHIKSLIDDIIVEREAYGSLYEINVEMQSPMPQLTTNTYVVQPVQSPSFYYVERDHSTTENTEHFEHSCELI